MSLLARALGCTVRWVGIGADPPPARGRFSRARLAIALTSAVSVRDEGSADVLRTLRPGGPEPTVGLDLAFLAHDLGIFDAALRSRPPRALLISVRGGARSRYEARALQEGLVAAARSALEAPGGFEGVEVVSFATLVDADATEELGELLTKALPGVPIHVEPAPHPRDMLAALTRAAAVVSVRMHGWLIARLMGRPAVGVTYAPKVSRVGAAFAPPPLISAGEVINDPSALAALLARQLHAPSPLRYTPDEVREGGRRSLLPVTEFLAP